MMNNFNMNDTRSRRNLLNWTGIFPFQSVANYSSDSTKMKMDMKNNFGDSLFINNLHLIPDPLKKNLADSIITGEVKTKTNMAPETKTFINEPTIKRSNSEDHRTDFYQSLGGITNFLSGVFNFVSGAMFHKRANSPTQYYECFEQNLDETAPSLTAWHFAKPEVQNKNGRAHNVFVSHNVSTNEPINNDSSTGSQNENKLKQVCLVLQNQHSAYQSDSECPKKMFVEQNSIEDCYEDAFTPEDFETLPDATYLEYYGPFSHQNSELLISDAPKIRTEYMPLTENMEITSTLPDLFKNVTSDNTLTNNETNDNKDDKHQIVETCEDKMNKLKALLQGKCKNKSKNGITTAIENIPSIEKNEQQTEPILIPKCHANKKMSAEENKEQKVKTSANKTFCNKFFDKSAEKDMANLKCSIDDLDSDPSSDYLDPCNYFDEVTGKFCSTSVDSEDSFQIVFTDSPKSCRGRLPSECESEDSFIVFEDTPDSCYSSKDVFGDELYINGYETDSSSDSDSSNDTDSSEECDDSDSESDSGCDAFNLTCKLSHSLSRTIGDLTDDSLYKIDEDEVDCAAVFVQEKPVGNISNERQTTEESEEQDTENSRGLLINEKRKMEKKKLPKKSVRFSDKPPEVHVMRVWAFAARQARAGHWERYALDRERFKRRIADVEMAVSWVLKPQHRARVMFQRFMPWWNAQKRKELAENEKRKKEEKQKEVRDTTNDKFEAELHSESDFKTGNVKIDNNLNKCHCEEKMLGVEKDIQLIEKSNGTCEIEVQEGNLEKTKTPNGIRKNGQIPIFNNNVKDSKFVDQADIDLAT